MPESFLLTDRPARASTTAAEKTADDCFVLDLDSGSYYSLGEVGGFVWERLDGESELGAIVDSVAASFEVGRHEAKSDVLEFVAGLGQLGLLESTRRP